MTTPSTPQVLRIYQGEDWAKVLLYYSDTAQTTPLVFENPYMEIRKGRRVYATFDVPGSAADGAASIPAPGQLRLDLPHAASALIPKGIYDVDIFADVEGERKAITKLGYLQIAVDARNTQDPA